MIEQPQLNRNLIEGCLKEKISLKNHAKCIFIKYAESAFFQTAMTLKGFVLKRKKIGKVVYTLKAF